MNNRKGYKAFKKGLVCAPDKDHVKQYAENTVYEEDGGNICNPGMMHYCVNPLDCLDYYPLIDDDGNPTEFCEVEALEKPVTDDNKKFATKKLKVGAKLDFAGFVKASVEFIHEKTLKNTKAENSSGNYAQIGSSGDAAQIGSSGYAAKIGSSGYAAKIGSSGDAAKIGSSGNYAQIGSSGNAAKIGSSGNYAQIGSSGNAARIDVSGAHSVAAAVGANGIIRAKLGCWITLAEWRYDEHSDVFVPDCVKSAIIDGEALKPDVWYRLENGEFVEVEP